MSGIAGVIDFSGRPVDREQAAKMASAMSHRGPDGISTWADSIAAFAHCMLRTTPESLGEHQPLPDEGANLVLAMDGRVDNWEGLRRTLLDDGAVLRDRSDAELVLKAYQRWGADCVRYLEGDFAIAIWDVRRREAFFARDRMGSKPFYYCWTGTALVFASELHAIFDAMPPPRRLNEGMLAELLAGEWLSHDATLWEGILRLPRALALVVGRAGPRLHEYWKPDTDRVITYRSEGEFFEHYRDWLRERVRRLSRSHRSLAFDVSGGLDSSAVFCIAEHLRREGRLLAPDINGYTTTYFADPEADEIEFARAAGRFVGVPIREIPRAVTAPDWYLARASRWRDFPGFPNASTLTEMRRQSVLDGCRVALTGETGDNWLDGSRLYYAEEMSKRRWRSLYDCVRADILAYGLPKTLGWALRYGVFPLLSHRDQAILRRLLGKPVAAPREAYWLTNRLRAALRGRRKPRRSQVGERRPGQRETLDRLDGAFMAQVTERIEFDASLAGIELRHPFHDAAFVELMLAIPERFRLRGNTNKYIHVQALTGFVPAEVLLRKDKADFTHIIVRSIAAIGAELTEATPRRHPDWLVREGVERLLQELGDGSRNAWPIWPLWGIFGCDLVVGESAIHVDHASVAA